MDSRVEEVPSSFFLMLTIFKLKWALAKGPTIRKSFCPVKT